MSKRLSTTFYSRKMKSQGKTLNKLSDDKTIGPYSIGCSIYPIKRHFGSVTPHASSDAFFAPG